MMKDYGLESKWFVLGVDGTTAGTTDVASLAPTNITGYQSVSLIAHLGAVVAAGQAKLIAGFGSDSSAASIAYSSGADWVVGSSDTTTDMSEQLMVLTIHNPPHPWVSAKVDKGGQNVTVDDLIGVAFNRFGSQIYTPDLGSTGLYGCYSSVSITSPSTSS
jgi:hypothetical protein